MARVSYICLHIFLKPEHFLLILACTMTDEQQMLEYGCYNVCTMGSTCSYFTTSIIQFQDVILENTIPTWWLRLTLFRCYNLTDSAERNTAKGHRPLSYFWQIHKIRFLLAFCLSPFWHGIKVYQMLFYFSIWLKLGPSDFIYFSFLNGEFS